MTAAKNPGPYELRRNEARRHPKTLCGLITPSPPPPTCRDKLHMPKRDHALPSITEPAPLIILARTRGRVWPRASSFFVPGPSGGGDPLQGETAPLPGALQARHGAGHVVRQTASPGGERSDRIRGPGDQGERRSSPLPAGDGRWLQRAEQEHVHPSTRSIRDDDAPDSDTAAVVIPPPLNWVAASTGVSSRSLPRRHARLTAVITDAASSPPGIRSRERFSRPHWRHPPPPPGRSSLLANGGPHVAMHMQSCPAARRRATSGPAAARHTQRGVVPAPLHDVRRTHAFPDSLARTACTSRGSRTILLCSYVVARPQPRSE
ncbi:hypothetical protein CDD83_11122 [Cordyceps sp. RAO-2017]|nr:hypothetical protein CDD83_11122 [Cordyceps sp. RAO-2017]